MANEAEERVATAVGPEVARLELVVREVGGPGGPVERDLEVTSQASSATVGDLVDAVTGPAAPGRGGRAAAVQVDGRPVPLDRPLRSSGLRRGSILTVRSPAATVSGPGGAASRSPTG